MLGNKAPEKKHKKERSNIIICPRCGAGNLANQSACGRCGLVFPKENVQFKGKKGEFGPGERGEPGAAPPALIPPSLPGAPRGNPPAIQEGGNGEEDGTGGEPARPEPPKRPKQLPEKGATEGIVKGDSLSLSCPRCGMDVRADAKRCSHCGFKR